MQHWHGCIDGVLYPGCWRARQAGRSAQLPGHDSPADGWIRGSGGGRPRRGRADPEDQGYTRYDVSAHPSLRTREIPSMWEIPLKTDCSSIKPHCNHIS
eukprot:scaffold135838_cov36-Tisochrysis_lutea.AAC.1